MPKSGKVIRFTGQMEIPFEEFSSRGGDERPRQRDLYARSRIEVQPTREDPPGTRVINYVSLGSGSSGNSCYIGIRGMGVIVDAGVKADFVEATLRANGVRMENVKGILLTHDHSDHVKYAYTLLRAHKHMRLYCTYRVLNGLLRRHGISKRIKDYHVPIFKEIPFKLAGMEITPFDVPHDGSDNMGFSLSYDNRNFVIATDLGAVSERAGYYMSRASYLVIESNYDLEMLKNGPYPEYLKARIQTDHGHLDNADTAAFLRMVWNKKMEYIFLCHLSKDNNTPAKALRAVRDALGQRGVKIGMGLESLEDRRADVQLMALPRFEATRWFVFRPGNGAED